MDSTYENAPASGSRGISELALLDGELTGNIIQQRQSFQDTWQLIGRGAIVVIARAMAQRAPR